MSFSASPASGYVGIPQTITINLASITNTDTTMPPIDPSVTNFDTQFSATTDCGVITDKKINSTTQAQLTLTSSTECTSKSLTVNYTQNKYFNALLNQAYTVNISKHTPTISLESQNGTLWGAFPFNTSGNKASKATDYKLRIKVIDGDGLGHATIPAGVARVKATSGTYTIKDVASAAVSVNADGYYHLTLDAEGYAVFTINFSDSPANITIQYDYMGSDVFKSSPSVLATNAFTVQ